MALSYKQYNQILWVLNFILLILLVNFIIRPSLFIISGVLPEIEPSLLFKVANGAFVWALLLIVFINVFMLIMEIDLKNKPAKIIYTIINIFVFVIALCLIIYLSINATECNNVNIPDNPCNSNYYCCKYGSALPECQNIIFPTPDCNVPSFVLSNLIGNEIFIEYFVWVCVIAILTVGIFLTQLLANPIKKHTSMSTIETKIGNLNRLNLGRSFITSHVQDEHLKPVDDTEISYLVNHISKSLYSSVYNLMGRASAAITNKYDNFLSMTKKL